MQKLVLASLIFVLVTGCVNAPVQLANSSTSDVGAGSAASGSSSVSEPQPILLQDIDSFRLADPEPPVVKDKEFDEIPVEVNPKVQQWMAYFQGKGRKHMTRYLGRSTRYSSLMKRILRQNNMPEDLIYIALIESGFSSVATSRAAAVGYWQFIRGTGRRYGLEINKLIDERRDPVLSTQAAAAYFKELYGIFGSWYLAMASYNVGENRVLREVRRNYTRNFWEIARKKRLPKETINYIPKFIAAKIIASDPAKYGFDEVEYEKPIEFEHVTVDQPVNLKLMAQKMSMDYEELKKLNPKFRGEIAPLKQGKLELRVPFGQTSLAMNAAKDSFTTKVELIADNPDTTTYKVRRGDTLSTIARRFHTTQANLRDLNDLRKRQRLKVGSYLQVPERVPHQSSKQVAKSSAAEGHSTHVVRSGESLSTIARKYGVSVQALRKANNLRRRSVLRAGNKLVIPGVTKPMNVESRHGDSDIIVHVVRRGETLQNIARRYRVPIHMITRQNRLPRGSKLSLGSRLHIPTL